MSIPNEYKVVQIENKYANEWILKNIMLKESVV